jgi:hypothetical protein
MMRSSGDKVRKEGQSKECEVVEEGEAEGTRARFGL